MFSISHQSDGVFPAGMTPAHGTPLGLPSTPLSDMSLFSDMDFPTASTPWANGTLVHGLSNYHIVDAIDAGNPLDVTTPMSSIGSKTQGHLTAMPNGYTHSSGMGQYASTSWLQEADASTPVMMGMIAPNSAERRALDVLADAIDADHTSARRVRYNAQTHIRMGSPAPTMATGAMEPPTRTPGSRLFPSSSGKATGIAGTLTRSASRNRSGSVTAPLVSHMMHAAHAPSVMSPMLDLSGILQSSMVSDDNDTDMSGVFSHKKRKRSGSEVICICRLVNIPLTVCSRS